MLKFSRKFILRIMQTNIMTYISDIIINIYFVGIFRNYMVRMAVHRHVIEAQQLRINICSLFI